MRSRHVGQQGRSVRNSCGNPLTRMDALRVSYVHTQYIKDNVGVCTVSDWNPISAIAVPVAASA
jgi:hypothetical protein